MFGDYYEKYIPVMYRHDSLELDDESKLFFLGRENLQCLAAFWKQHAETCQNISEDMSKDYKTRERNARQAADERRMFKELSDMAKKAASKPCLFERPAIKTGSRVTCFLENPDRYVSGIVAKVNAGIVIIDDAADGKKPIVHIDDVTMLVRLSDQQVIRCIPDNFTPLMTEDFEYFRQNKRYFRTYLKYRVRKFPEEDKVERMLACLQPPSTPPDVA